MMDVKEVLLLWLRIFLIKKTSGSGVNNKIRQNQELAEELHKPILNNLKKEEFTLYLKTTFGMLI